jgi:hypothetical protein
LVPAIAREMRHLYDDDVRNRNSSNNGVDEAPSSKV